MNIYEDIKWKRKLFWANKVQNHEKKQHYFFKSHSFFNDFFMPVCFFSAASVEKQQFGIISGGFDYTIYSIDTFFQLYIAQRHFGCFFVKREKHFFLFG